MPITNGNSSETDDFITILLKLNGNNCNMQCEYCYNHVQKISIADNDNDKALSAIKFLSGYTHYQHVLIVFHGGEPLLSPIEELSAILDYIKKCFRNIIHVQIQTNGTLLNSKWLSLFQKYNDILSVSISIDPLGKKDLRVYPEYTSRDKVLENAFLCSGMLKNTGIISVIHKKNIESITTFIRFLMEHGIKNFTINKYQSTLLPEQDDYYITEMEYTNALITITKYIISEHIYKDINIQPIYSLFSKNGSKICRYMPNENKCRYFKTYFSNTNYYEYCDHIIDNLPSTVTSKCHECDIYSKCGSGCLLEKKDDTFCLARKKLVVFLEEMRNENIKS